MTCENPSVDGRAEPRVRRCFTNNGTSGSFTQGMYARRSGDREWRARRRRPRLASDVRADCVRSRLSSHVRRAPAVTPSNSRFTCDFSIGGLGARHMPHYDLSARPVPVLRPTLSPTRSCCRPRPHCCRPSSPGTGGVGLVIPFAAARIAAPAPRCGCVMCCKLRTDARWPASGLTELASGEQLVPAPRQARYRLASALPHGPARRTPS